MSDLTPWFPPEVTPVRKGVYEATLVEGEAGWYAYWRGDSWGGSWKRKDVAARIKMESSEQRKWWRGLAEKP